MSQSDPNKHNPKVFWAVLLERTVNDNSVGSLLDVAMHAGARGYTRINWPYSRTDAARNNMVETFMKETSHPDDALVMMDNDHLYPPDLIDRLLKWNVDVVGALAFRRGPPYFPCFFLRLPGGELGVALEYERGLLECALVGTGAVCIRRRVFETLEDAGYTWPYFRYQYNAGDKLFPSEDIYFGQTCEKAGIPHHVDTTFCIPHLSPAMIDEDSWLEFQKQNESVGTGGFDWGKAMKGGGATIGQTVDATQADRETREELAGQIVELSRA